MCIRLAALGAACLLALNAVDPRPGNGQTAEATPRPSLPPVTEILGKDAAPAAPAAVAGSGGTAATPRLEPTPRLRAEGGMPSVSVLPTRDVTVRYKQTEGDGALDGLVLSFRAGERLMRVEQRRERKPGAPSAIPLLANGRFLIVDGAADRTILVDPAASTYEEMDPDGALAYGVWGGPADRAKAVPGPAAVIAGQACETWRFEDPDGGEPQEACLTRDGVALRASETMEGKRQAFEAVAVDYGEQDAARFRIPPGFRASE